MTKREHILLNILIIILLFVSIGFIFTTYNEKITYADSKIAEYTDALLQLPLVSNDDKELLTKQLQERKQKINPELQDYSISDVTKIIKENLANQLIIPKKIQITENKNLSMVEFTLSCDPELFFRFLEDINKFNSIFTIDYLVIKTTDSGIDIVLRVSHA